MGKFTITQHNPKKDRLYIYPNYHLNGECDWCTGGICTQWDNSTDGAIYNYQCIDEEELDLTDYVSMATDSYVTDLYNLPTQSDLGSINYVKIHTIARTMTDPLPSLEYYICISDESCATIYNSKNLNLTTGWSKKSYVWKENPSSSTGWTWDDIDTLYIGIKAKSPKETIRGTKKLNPNGDVRLDWDTNNASTGYECLNNSDRNKYISSKTDNEITVNSYENSGSTQGTPQEVKFFIYVEGGDCTILPCLSFGFDTSCGTEDDWWNYYEFTDGCYGRRCHGYNIHSINKTKSPDGDNWTWDDIDDLCSVISIYNDPARNATLDVFQTYFLVDWKEENASTEIRVAQEYAEIGYSPSSTTCTLNKPTEISTNHSRNTKMLNFWNGDREVYDYNRSSNNMVLKGEEVYSDSCDTILCIRNIARNGATITIEDLNPTYFNDEYKIKSFGWKKISEKPEHYEWILELERAEN